MIGPDLIHRGWEVWTGPGDPKRAGCTYPWSTPWRVRKGEKTFGGTGGTLNEAMMAAIRRVDIEEGVITPDGRLVTWRDYEAVL